MKYKGLHVREETWDSWIIEEVAVAYQSLGYKGRVVLDLGSNIGAFARYAMDHGAKRVVCVEPCSENINLLKKNKVEGIEIREGAVTRSHVPQVPFYKTPSNNHGLGSSYINRSEEQVWVNNINLQALMVEVGPELIKVDIEGGEYILFNYTDDIPESVKDIMIEFHYPHEPYMQSQLLEILKYLKSQKFKTIIEPKLVHCEGTMGYFRRGIDKNK